MKSKSVGKKNEKREKIHSNQCINGKFPFIGLYQYRKYCRYLLLLLLPDKYRNQIPDGWYKRVTERKRKKTYINVGQYFIPILKLKCC